MRRAAATPNVIATLTTVATLLVLSAPMARPQSCAPARVTCERDADVEMQRCSVRCTRYDTVCLDRCDDAHDIVVRYCRIRADLCRSSEDARDFLKASNRRE